MKRLILLVYIYIMSAEFMQATGPSFIHSNIRPVSINGRGDILCRSRFTHNDMGSHRFMKISYGYCIISNRSINEFPAYELNPDAYEENIELFEKERKRCDSIFHSKLDLKQADSIIHKFNNEYHFKSANVERNKINRFFTIPAFEALKKQKNISSLIQKALKGARSIAYGEECLNRIFVEYDFGNIIFLSNKVSYECVEYNHEDDTDNCFGASFDYYYPLLGTNLEYEISDVTGILFLTDNNK